MEEYDLPDVERIAAEILRGIVRDDQIGPQRVDVFSEYLDGINGTRESGMVSLEDFDFIQLKRRAGYLDDTWTDIAGLEVDVWAKTRDRAVFLMNEVTKRILASEWTSVDGFPIDHVELLNGPEFDPTAITDERNVTNNYELQIRVRWK